jgi:hypothetical protein
VGDAAGESLPRRTVNSQSLNGAKQESSDADVASKEHIDIVFTARSTCDAKGNRLVTAEPSTAGHNWPDTDEFGDGALDQVRAAWPHLSRDLRLAIVAIGTHNEQSTIDQDGSN